MLDSGRHAIFILEVGMSVEVFIRSISRSIAAKLWVLSKWSFMIELVFKFQAEKKAPEGCRKASNISVNWERGWEY